MEAHEIIAVLQRRGAGIRVLDDGRLEVSPSRVLDDGLRGAIRANKTQVIAALHRVEASELTEGAIVEARHELGAVLIRSRRFACEVWLALTGEMAADLRAEESTREQPRPVLLPADVASLRGKSDEATKAVLDALACFPGSELIRSFSVVPQ